MIQAWAHKTPWLFGDELELTQLSRAIADTGHAARRGEPYSFTTLWTYVLAPAWLIDNLHAAYATVKYLTVIVMTATVFPAYGIARLLRRPQACPLRRSCVRRDSRRRVLVDDRRGAVRLLLVDSDALPDPPRTDHTVTLVDRRRGGAALIAPLVRGELAMLPVDLPARRNLPPLAVRVRSAGGAGAGARGTGSAS